MIDGALSYGDLSAFLMYSVFTGFSCGTLASSYAELRRASGASERVLRLLEPDLPPRAVETLPHFGGDVELRSVGFAYPTQPERAVLSGLMVASAPVTHWHGAPAARRR